MDPLSSAEFLWLFVVGVCLGCALVKFGWLPIVMGFLMSALVIKEVGWLLVLPRWLISPVVDKAVTALLEAWAWLISRSVDENAETTLLEAWANRISLGNEFEILNEQLLKLGALLTSARGFRTNNSELKEFVEELQQLKYQAENLLDELDYYRLEDQIQQRGGTQEKGNYISQSSAATSSSDFWLASRSILSTFKGMSGLVSLPKTFRINLSRRMNELAEQLQKSEEKVRYALQTKSLVISKTARNTKISHTEATKLHQLRNLLTNEESAMVGEVPVIAIVGSGGVGKTTLARLVFTDPKICSYFEVRLWICVSTQFDSVRLTREMLEGACGNKYDGLSNLRVLQKILKNKLESKRFLLVLDDMWEDEHKSQWDLMVAPLNYCRVRGNIILVTTRNQSVAKLVGARDIIYLQGQTSLFLTEPTVFERHQERDQLMNLLTNKKSAMVGKVPVIAIVGGGGVGKTTLARLVFTDPKICSYFEVRLWICVSTQFDSVRLTREMLEGACGNKYDGLSNLKVLQKILKDKLESKRFLLVLDDMWEDEHKSQWDLMVAPLKYCRVRGSIILVTTRNQYVAKLVGARDIIYLPGLDDDAFSSFFSTCIFNDPNYGENWRLRNIRQQIASLDERYLFEIRDSEEWKSESGPNDIFGRHKERDQLMNLLTNKKSAMLGKVPVIAIVGSGGVGKTTLAGLVFADPKICNYFKVRLWICVSTQFDSVRLTREMLEDACGNKYDGLSNLNELQKILKDKLEYKRFLLVLDDMWEDEHKSQWDLMVAPLNYCKVRGSIILVTTRNQSVAKLVGARDTIYLPGLDDNAFSSFFSTCIFNDPNYGGNWMLRNIGQQIANKLKGNPLAAKTVSAQLKKNLDERYWIEVRDSEEWKSQSGSNDILYALRLNYEYMPIHLQRCFSCCAIFPEDHPFTCKELVYLWMAQGFLDVRSERKMMEDIGSAYFNDLFNFGFFQIKQSKDGLVYYTFNDFIHDLAHSVAFKECLTIDGTKPRQILPTIRHLSISGSTERSEDAIVAALACLKGENLRTIIIWDDELPSGVCQSISDLLKKTKFLRAMRLKLGSMVQQHNFIQNFVSLRYLSLNLQILPGSIITSSYTLPREICRLYHLEVFKIEGGGFLDELPNNFSDLISLWYFIVEGKLHSKICGVGNLTSLQELNYFNVQENIGFEIEQLGSLKEIGGSLQISNLENVKSKEEASKARLAKKENLDVLYLKWNLGEQEAESVLEGLRPNTNLKSLTIDGYGGVASPTWLDPSLIFLESLTLKGCKAWKQLPPIGNLESLKHLELSGMAVREIGPQCYGTHQSMKFSSLEVFEITHMPDLENLVWSDQLQLSLCFKKLKKLTVVDCPKLVDLPLSGSATSLSERFPSLESLKIKDCPLKQLPPIGNLESLKHLELSGMALREIGPQCYGTHQSMIFPSLEVFEITHMQDLEKLVWSDQLQLSLCFKKLKKLTVVDCPKLVDLPLSGSATSLSERFPSLESLKIKDCPLIFQLPPLPYSSLLSSVSIATTRFIKYMDYRVNSDCGITRKCCLSLDQSSSLKVGEILSLRVFSSLHVLEFSCISSLKSIDLHSFVALKTLVIKECQSLTSLTFGEHLFCLRSLSIISCETLTTMNGLRSWVNLEWLHFQKCPGFVAAWDSASKEIERTKPDFSLSLTRIEGDSLALLTLPICKQLKSLQAFLLEVSCFAEDNVVSLQLLNSIDLVDIEGRKNLQSFPFDLFPSLKHLTIKFPHIDSLPTSNDTEISEEFSNLRQIKGIYIGESPVMIYFNLSSEEMIWQQMDPISADMDGFQFPLFWNQNYRRIYQSI